MSCSFEFPVPFPLGGYREELGSCLGLLAAAQ